MVRCEKFNNVAKLFDYIFVDLRQKARLRPELSPTFLSTLGPNPIQTRPEKPGPTYNSGTGTVRLFFCKRTRAVGWF